MEVRRNEGMDARVMEGWVDRRGLVEWAGERVGGRVHGRLKGLPFRRRAGGRKGG
jgi:hypothetical protein